MDAASSIAEDLDTFTVLIKNCPKNKQEANSETLLDFVKRLTWQENVEIEKVGSDYAVKFVNVPTDAEEVINHLKSETYLGTWLDIVQVKKLKNLHLGNLKQDVQSMEICLYLEQPKFLPINATEDYRVEVLCINHNNNYALVQVPDEADISLYINAEHSDILGKGLRISEYVPAQRSKEDQNKYRCGWRGERAGKQVQGKRPDTCGKTGVQQKITSKSPQPQSRQQVPLSVLPLLPAFQEDPKCPFPLRGLPFVEWINIEEVDKEKCQLMKKLLPDLRKSLGDGWKLWLDEKLHRVGIGHCDCMKLQGAIFAVREKLASMTSACLQLPGEFALSVKSGRGYGFVIKFFELKHLRAVYYFNQKMNRGMVLGENKEVARMAAKVLNEEFYQHIFEPILVVENKNVDQELQWFISSVMRDHLVHVSLVVANYGAGTQHIKQVMLQGFKSSLDFSKAKTKIDQKLSVTIQNVSVDERHQMTEQGRMSGDPTPSSSSRPGSAASSSSGQTKSTGPIIDVATSIKMSPLVYQFFKTHLSNLITDKCKYMMPEQSLAIRGKREEVLPIFQVIESVKATIVEKQATIKIAGITEGFFNEKNSELRSEILKFELEHKFAINFSTGKDKDTILDYAFKSMNKKSPTFPEMIKELLMNFSKKKSIRCSEMFASVGAPGGIITGRLKDSISNVKHGFVKVKYDDQSDAILLQGREKFFDIVEKVLADIFRKHLAESLQAASQEKVDMTLQMRTSYLPDFLKAIGHEDIFAPDHWVTFTGNLRHVSNGKGQIISLDPNSTMYKYIQDMVCSTWMNGQVGVGRDATLLKHREVQIFNIYSVENVFQYKRYMTRLKEFCLQNSGSGFSRLDSSLDVPVLTRAMADKHGLHHLLWEANEYHLFHGTKLDSKQAIIDQGLDFRLGSRYALFGQGIYFSENSTKSDQYADPKENRSGPGDSLFMFVARVFMGRMHRATRPEPYKRPPCTDPQCSSDKCSIHPLNDSVIGTHTTTHSLTHYNYLTTRLKVLQDGGPSSSSSIPSSKELEKVKEQLNSVRPLLFREFVIYDPSQCFPEFLIEYKRI